MAMSLRAIFTSSSSWPRRTGVNDTSVKVFNSNLPLIQSHKWSIPVPAESKFLQFTGEMSGGNEVEMKRLRDLVREMAGDIDGVESLEMMDAVQRLGIEEYFREEIEAALPTHYSIALATNSNYDGKMSSLKEVALRFRLLRQHGYFVSADVFEGFMDEKDHIAKDLKANIEGLTSLYEASQICIPGEDKLERAGNFCAQILKTSIGNLDHQVANHVGYTLANPFHKSLSKLLVKNFLEFGAQFQHRYKWACSLQQMAKIDFKRAQSVYQHEILLLAQWWGQTGLSKKLTFARDQPLKWYFCSLAILTGPSFSQERVDLTKAISFIYLLDDIYDLYGSLHELRLFTDAIRRWDMASTENLPDSMKICFKALYETTNEMSWKIYKKHGWNPIDSLHKSWAKLSDAFLVEAEWFGSGHVPSTNEYLKNGGVSSGVHVALEHIFFLLGQGISQQTVQLLDTNPGIVSNTAIILRLRDDMGSSKDENQEGFDGSYIEYYMKENEGVSMERTRQHMMEMSLNAWKRLNEECISPNNIQFPLTFKEASQNLARLVPLLYGYDQNQNLPTLEKLMKSVVYESLEM